VFDLKRRTDAGEALVVLDVREPDEIATAALPGATLIPMGEIPARYAELPSDRPIVVLCHAGSRSARVAQFLNENGYPNAVNLAGGIDAWSVAIDPGVPRYRARLTSWSRRRTNGRGRSVRHHGPSARRSHRHRLPRAR